ncbi:pantoate--beta-alanine ligase [Robertkochia aurantiaca]|uniref:pantoate--beta-alanine ligase n=1 Tax=Robertkochia aurantiaca TaxID=2873700 RepID=UPI001CCFC58C|nr:pantoate--beta-alanine ligase [Robertkochia sp. 3YJGBD-33]
MFVFKHKNDLISHLDKERSSGHSIALVPTMGALHEGHLSLIKRALSECDRAVVSIFVNPTQFDNPEDLEKYPQNLESDLASLQDLSDEIIVFTPSASEMYNTDVKAQAFDFDGLEHQMEGKFRKGHFDGVGTIVGKLLELIEPDRAFFGEKDFQQLQIIKKLVEKQQLPVTIVGCPISREENGLARSSRNERLSPEQRDQAAFIYKSLREAREKIKTENADSVIDWIEKSFKSHPFLNLEYAEIADENTLKPVKELEKNKNYRLFIAVYANDVRLIDNIALN